MPCGVYPEGPPESVVWGVAEVFGRGIPQTGGAEGKPDWRRASAAGPRAHDDFDPAQVRSAAGDRVYQREECDSPGASVRTTEAAFCGAKFLGARIVRVNGCAGGGVGSRVHPHAGGRGQALGSVEHVALKWPPAGGQEHRGRVSDPAQPLRAAHKLKPPALPGDTYSGDRYAPRHPEALWRLGFDTTGCANAPHA